MDSVVHFEIPVNDLEKAKKFYSSVFKWHLESIPEMQYTVARTCEVDDQRMPKHPGAINGGMMKKNSHVKNPVITINVENIDKSIEMIKNHGGKIIGEKIVVADMGIAAYFEDTEGNILGLWQTTKKY